MQSAFAIELFFIIFSVLCWLVTPMEALTVSSTKQPMSVERNDITNDEKLSPSILEEVKNVPATKQDYSVWDSLTPIHVQQDYYVGIIEELNATQARKAASKLKKQGIIDQSTKLAGKGIGRDRLIFLLQDHLPAHQQEVKQALELVLKRELL